MSSCLNLRHGYTGSLDIKIFHGVYYDYYLSQTLYNPIYYFIRCSDKSDFHSREILETETIRLRVLEIITDSTSISFLFYTYYIFHLLYLLHK